MTKHASHFHRVGDSKEQEYLAGWQRARAELDNFRRRVKEERVGQQHMALQALIVELLPLADNLRAAAAHVPAELAAHPWVVGIIHIERQYGQLLAQLGVEVIGTVGEEFNPACHEAVAAVAGGGEGKVVEVLQPGYKMGEKVLRPAKVKVSE